MIPTYLLSHYFTLHIKPIVYKVILIIYKNSLIYKISHGSDWWLSPGNPVLQQKISISLLNKTVTWFPHPPAFLDVVNVQMLRLAGVCFILFFRSSTAWRLKVQIMVRWLPISRSLSSIYSRKLISNSCNRILWREYFWRLLNIIQVFITLFLCLCLQSKFCWYRSRQLRPL